jgi:peptide/nickel transport system permease protein
LTHKQKLVGALVLLAAFQSFILFAGFFAPYDFATQDRERPFAPPTTLHFMDTRGNVLIRPVIYNLAGSGPSVGASQTDSEHPYPVHFFVRGAPYKIAGVFASNMHLFRNRRVLRRLG